MNAVIFWLGVVLLPFPVGNAPAAEAEDKPDRNTLGASCLINAWTL